MNCFWNGWKFYGTNGEVQATHSKFHEYLGMTIALYDAVKVKIDMVNYIRNMIDKYTKNITGISPTPAIEDLFSGWKCNPLPK